MLFYGANTVVSLTRLAAGLQDNSRAILHGVSSDVRSLVEQRYRDALVELEVAGATSSATEREASLARAADHLRSAQGNPELSAVARAECAAILAILSAREGDESLARHWVVKAMEYHDVEFRALRDWAVRLATREALWSPRSVVWSLLSPGGPTAPLAHLGLEKWSRWRERKNFPATEELEVWERHAQSVAALARLLGADTTDRAVGLRDRPVMTTVAFDLPFQPAIPNGLLLLAEDEDE